MFDGGFMSGSFQFHLPIGITFVPMKPPTGRDQVIGLQTSVYRARWQISPMIRNFSWFFLI